MRKYRTAAFTGVAALVVQGLVALPAGAAQKVDPGAIDPSLTPVNLLNINDFHGYFSNDFACTFVQQRALLGGPEKTAFLSAGDNVGASSFASASQQDKPTIEFLNTLGLEASAVGNHEFDGGFADLTNRIQPLAKFTNLGANVYQKGTTTPALPEHKVIDVNGVKVGVIGLVTPSTAGKVSPAGISTIEFGPMVEAANRVAAQLSDGNAANGEADIVVAEFHEGATTSNQDYATTKANSAIFAEMVDKSSKDIDVIFNGDSHQTYTIAGPVPGGAGADDTRPVVQSGNYGSNLGVVQLGWDPTTKTVKQYSMQNVATKGADPAKCADDATFTAAKAIVDKANAEAATIGQKVIGKATADITRATADGKDRTTESPLSNLIAQAYLDGLAMHGFGNATIGVMNPGGVRANLTAGDITYKQAADIMPFNNIVKTVDLTGAQFKQVLEEQWAHDAARAPYLQLGLSKNVTYTWNPDAPLDNRITSIMVDGKPIDMNKTYTIASNSFLLEGGDGFTTFKSGTNLKDSGLVDMSLFVEWITKQGTISPSFTKHAVAITPPVKDVYDAGDTVSFQASSLNMLSTGAPIADQVTVKFDGQVVAAPPAHTTVVTGVPNRPGTADVNFAVPAGATTGAHTITLEWNGSVATIPVNVKGAAPVRQQSTTTLSLANTGHGKVRATVTATLPDGSTPVGSVRLVDRRGVVVGRPTALVDGKAVFELTGVKPGLRQFTAFFTPADSATVRYSYAKDVVFVRYAPGLTAKCVAGGRVRVSMTKAYPGTGPLGTVKVKVNGATRKAYRMEGRRSIRFTQVKLPSGTRRLTYAFQGDEYHHGGSVSFVRPKACK